MERVVGTVVRGLRAPIINQGDDVVQMAVDTFMNAANAEGSLIEDRDILAITESVVARAQGNYASIDDVAADVKAKFGGEKIGVLFPILSRNRFANCLRGIARGAAEIVLMLSYPADEVGNHLLDIDELDDKGVNPWTDVLTEKEFRGHFGFQKHTFTGIDYINYYKPDRGRGRGLPNTVRKRPENDSGLYPECTGLRYPHALSHQTDLKKQRSAEGFRIG